MKVAHRVGITSTHNKYMWVRNLKKSPKTAKFQINTFGFKDVNIRNPKILRIHCFKRTYMVIKQIIISNKIFSTYPCILKFFFYGRF